MFRLKNDIEKIYEEKCDDDPNKYCPYLNMVWLHCDGEDDPDKENLGLVSRHTGLNKKKKTLKGLLLCFQVIFHFKNGCPLHNITLKIFI